MGAGSYSPKVGSLLDHVIARENSTVLLDRPKVLELISDHRLIHFDISKHQLPCKPTIIKFRKVNDIPCTSDQTGNFRCA